jgi:hypothetical protein
MERIGHDLRAFEEENRGRKKIRIFPIKTDNKKQQQKAKGFNNVLDDPAIFYLLISVVCCRTR